MVDIEVRQPQGVLQHQPAFPRAGGVEELEEAPEAQAGREAGEAQHQPVQGAGAQQRAVPGVARRQAAQGQGEHQHEPPPQGGARVAGAAGEAAEADLVLKQAAATRVVLGRGKERREGVSQKARGRRRCSSGTSASSG